MRMRGEDWVRVLVLSLLCAPAIAFMTFDFVFPNISTPSLGSSLVAIFLLSAVFGTLAGYFNRRIDSALATVFAYVTIGYVIALVCYSAPFLFYDFEVVLPGMYMMFFLNKTVFLVMIYIFGGIIGVVLGMILVEELEKEETSQSFSRWRN